MRFILLAALLLGLGSSVSSAQSFDCDDARIATEFAICDSRHLSRLDEDMADLYYDLPYDIREDIESSQRRWLRRRNACGHDRGCIARAYERRIDVLSQL